MFFGPGESKLRVLGSPEKQSRARVPTCSAWFSAGAVNRRTFWILAPFAVSLTLGTVYGRFHYGIDMAAGLVWASAAFLAAPPLIRRLGPRP